MAEQVGIGAARVALDRIAEHFAKAPAADGAPRAARGTAALWVAVAGLGIAVVILGSAIGLHIVGEETVRAQMGRTEKLVEWLVLRAMAEDAGERPPKYPLL